MCATWSATKWAARVLGRNPIRLSFPICSFSKSLTSKQHQDTGSCEFPLNTTFLHVFFISTEHLCIDLIPTSATTSQYEWRNKVDIVTSLIQLLLNHGLEPLCDRQWCVQESFDTICKTCLSPSIHSWRRFVWNTFIPTCFRHFVDLWTTRVSDMASNNISSPDFETVASAVPVLWILAAQCLVKCYSRWNP